jgi:hypothetical protein
MTATHWAVVYAIESACIAAGAGDDRSLLRGVSEAACSAAKYARLAQLGPSARKSLEDQRSILAEIFST